MDGEKKRPSKKRFGLHLNGIAPSAKGGEFQVIISLVVSRSGGLYSLMELSTTKGLNLRDL